MCTIRWFGGLACLAQFARAPRLVYAATRARSVLESGGALPLSLPRLFLVWLCFSHWVCWNHRRVLHRVYWVYAYYAFRHLGSLLASGCALACLRPAYAAAAVATIAIILLVSKARKLEWQTWVRLPTAWLWQNSGCKESPWYCKRQRAALSEKRCIELYCWDDRLRQLRHCGFRAFSITDSRCIPLPLRFRKRCYTTIRMISAFRQGVLCSHRKHQGRILTKQRILASGSSPPR